MLSGIEIFFFVVVVVSEHLNLFVLATEHTLLRMFFKYLASNFVSGRPA